MPENFRLNIEGLKQLKAKVRNGGEPLYGEPMVEAMELIGFKAADLVAQQAPVRSGATKAGIRHIVSSVRPIPAWVKVETTARKKSRRYPRGYPYPRLVNYWVLSRHYHWMTDAVAKVRGPAEQLLQQVARAIELKWKEGPIV